MFYKSNQPNQLGWFRKVLSEMAAGWASLPGFGKWLLVLSLGLLLISLTQPAFYIDWQDPRAYSNSRVLFFCGWMGFFAGSVDSFLWLANPLFFASVVLLLRRRKGSVYLAGGAFVLALAFAFMPSIMTGKSGERTRVTSLQAGYFLWLAGMAVLLICTMYVSWKRRAL
jgi:hypothetical protein